MRRVTLVIEGGDLGAAIARAVGVKQGLAWIGYAHRRGGSVQCTAIVHAEDKSARARWVKACKQAGLTVEPAPWEQRAKEQAHG